MTCEAIFCESHHETDTEYLDLRELAKRVATRIKTLPWVRPKCTKVEELKLGTFLNSSRMYKCTYLQWVHTCICMYYGSSFIKGASFYYKYMLHILLNFLSTVQDFQNVFNFKNRSIISRTAQTQNHKNYCEHQIILQKKLTHF